MHLLEIGMGCSVHGGVDGLNTLSVSWLLCAFCGAPHTLYSRSCCQSYMWHHWRWTAPQMPSTFNPVCAGLLVACLSKLCIWLMQEVLLCAAVAQVSDKHKGVLCGEQRRVRPEAQG